MATREDFRRRVNVSIGVLHKSISECRVGAEHWQSKDVGAYQRFVDLREDYEAIVQLLRDLEREIPWERDYEV